MFKCKSSQCISGEHYLYPCLVKIPSYRFSLYIGTITKILFTVTFHMFIVFQHSSVILYPVKVKVKN